MNRFLKALAIAGLLPLLPVGELGEGNLPPRAHRREVGVNLTVFNPDSVGGAHGQVFTRLASEGYSVAFDPVYYQKGLYASHVDTTTAMDIGALVLNAEAAGLDITLRPLINSRDNAPRDSIFSDFPDVWFKDYARILLDQAQIASRHRVKAICIGAELDRMLLVYPSRFNDVARKIRATGFKGTLYYSMGYAQLSDLRKLRVLNTLDIDAIGLDFYLPMFRQDSPIPSTKRQAGVEALFYLNQAVERSKKPLIISEVGYRSVRHANRRPYDWAMKGAPDPDAQNEAYKNFLGSLSSAEKAGLPIKGVYFWITDSSSFVHDINSSSAAGYSYFKKPAEQEVRKYIRRW